MSYETILVEQRGAVTLITLNRPQALNSFNGELRREFKEVLMKVSAVSGRSGPPCPAGV